MTVRQLTPDPPQSISVVLIDDDIIFRTGLRVWLEQQSEITVVGETERERSAAELIESAIKSSPASKGRDVVAVLGLTLALSSRVEEEGLTLCQVLRRRFETTPILVLGATPSASTLANLQQAGANGYALKTAPPDELVQRLRQIAAGGSAWITPSDGVLSSSPRRGTARLSKAIATPLSILKRNIRTSGFQQIDAALVELQAQLDYSAIEGLDRLILEGRCRELRAARWMVQALLSTPVLDDEQGDLSGNRSELDALRGDRPPRQFQRSDRSSNRPISSGASGGGGRGDASRWLQETDAGSAVIRAGVEATLFEGIAFKLQGHLRNVSDVPLEIDILREDKKRELLFTVVRKLHSRLDSLRQSKVTPRQISDGRSRILRDLWQSVADDFFGRYYAIQIEGLEVEVVTVLSDDAAIAQNAILDEIPYVSEFFAHLLFNDPLIVDSVTYVPGTPEAMVRAEKLLDHLVIQVANSVIQPLLNRLGDVEVIKQGFYDQNLMSSREMAKFRNNLSWRYRLERTVRDPINIFESRYQLFTIQGNGIKQTDIYAPRQAQLET
ncbi:MAG: DUF3685 domain-containing protein, partial [Leptolyngbyaceae bacterium]|nr:DUF3685 domain-containing protein [Leptolyngbyaceae bacterium]